MVKVSVMGSTGVIGKNVTFKLARADTISEVVLFARPESIDKAKGQSYDMYDALAAEDIDCLLTILIVYSPHPAIMKILQIPKLY